MSPARGDLVEISNTDEGILMHHRWGDKNLGHPSAFSRFLPGELGVVLESLVDQGGNGCRIVVAGKKMRVGWVNVKFLRTLQDFNQDV